MTTKSNQLGHSASEVSGATPCAARTAWFSCSWKWLIPVSLIVVIGLPLARRGSVFAAKPPAMGQAGVIQTQDANASGVTAELTQCKRSEGVLNIKIRFHNTSKASIHFMIITNRDYEKFYVTAAKKKYFILKDSEGAYLTPAAVGNGMLGVNIAPGESYTWWAKFPAPPADVKKLGLMTPITTPFDDVPISDQ